MCHLSTSPSPICMASSSFHHPFTTRHASRSFPRLPSRFLRPILCQVSLLQPSSPSYLLRSCPHNPMPPPLSCAPSFALASTHTHPPSCSVIPGGGVRSTPYPEMLSWFSRSQSQEAVIEAVGGG
jgi:hypothetical protein